MTAALQASHGNCLSLPESTQNLISYYLYYARNNPLDDTTPAV
eukprot:CAMPEP_0202911168 /NCGR_PEP_ID=MMETSP1392-20130828/54237_1 /ASSEMBLY_ACC=CAM_ASM_000868 /TAXON_ID=225041 /ORGANISM="Chlamydomonas chlamydogama, Strain SAG 11-48b" /LENGTH=42 /DNA_ID= /DNA_START= /DNA_END= /DNA_ORIENTATION=